MQKLQPNDVRVNLSHQSSVIIPEKLTSPTFRLQQQNKTMQQQHLQQAPFALPGQYTNFNTNLSINYQQPYNMMSRYGSVNVQPVSHHQVSRNQFMENGGNNGINTQMFNRNSNDMSNNTNSLYNPIYAQQMKTNSTFQKLSLRLKQRLAKGSSGDFNKQDTLSSTPPPPYQNRTNIYQNSLISPPAYSDVPQPSLGSQFIHTEQMQQPSMCSESLMRGLPNGNQIDAMTLPNVNVSTPTSSNLNQSMPSYNSAHCQNSYTVKHEQEIQPGNDQVNNNFSIPFLQGNKRRNSNTQQQQQEKKHKGGFLGQLGDDLSNSFLGHSPQNSSLYLGLLQDNSIANGNNGNDNKNNGKVQNQNISVDDTHLGSIEEIELMAQSLMDGLDGKSFDSFQEFLACESPLIESVNSPMSVESARTGSTGSSSSLKDLRNLNSLSLSLSPNNTDVNGQYGTAPSQDHSITYPPNKNIAAKITQSPSTIIGYLSPNVKLPFYPFTTVQGNSINQSSAIQTISVESSPKCSISSVTTTSIVTLVSSHLAASNIVPQNVSPFENIKDQDTVFKSENPDSADVVKMKMKMNMMKEMSKSCSSDPATEQSSNIESLFQHSKSEIGNAEMAQRQVYKVQNGDSNSVLKGSRVSPIGSSVKSPLKQRRIRSKSMKTFNNYTNETVKSVFSMSPGVDEKQEMTKESLQTIPHTSTVSRHIQQQQHSKQYNKYSKLKRLYFQNKDFYRVRQNLRELATLKSDIAKRYPTEGMVQASKLFLNQLDSTKIDNFVLNSVSPGVKDKDINLKNMTKRKITIYDDVPPEFIHEYSEENSHPFQYLLGDDTSGKLKPSQKLMSILTDKKLEPKKEKVEKVEKEIKVS